MQFTVVNRFRQPAAEVIAALLDTAVQEEVFATLGYALWQERSRTETPAGHLVRELRVEPPVTLPGFLRRIFPNTAAYSERQEWGAERQTYTFSVVFDVSDRATLSGRVHFRSGAGGGCERMIECDLKVRFPLISGRAERFIQQEVDHTQSAQAEALGHHLGGAQR